MNDLARELIGNDRQLTVAALGGNAGAGGCFLARAADLVWAREDVLLNPHYKNMGNLYGSEYWTYLLPRRLGSEAAAQIMRNRQPMTAQPRAGDRLQRRLPARRCGGVSRARSRGARANWRARPICRSALRTKRRARNEDEARKPLAAYREEELAHMRRNFYGFDPSYHVARHHFVHKSPASWTPRHLARHRDLGWSVP